MTKSKTFIEYELLCPHCGGEFLHHEVVEVFDRQEDEMQGIHIYVGERIYIESRLEGNPSDRRNALSVDFVCEFCISTG